MRWYRAGASVPAGLYLSPRALDAQLVRDEGMRLAGAETAGYLRVSPLAAPLIGLGFVLLLPVLVLCLSAVLAFRKALALIRSS